MLEREIAGFGPSGRKGSCAERSDPSSTRASQPTPVMGSFLFHHLTVGRPRAGWSEQVVDTLWPGFAAAPRPG